MTKPFALPTLSKAAGLGALLGFSAALAYGSLFCLYGVARVTAVILSEPANGTIFLVLSNALSLTVAAMFFAILCGLVAAPVQAAALTLTTVFSRRWNRAGSRQRGALIGLGCAALFLLALHGLVAAAPPLTARLLWESGYLLWSGLPGLIFIALNTWLGSKLPVSR